MYKAMLFDLDGTLVETAPEIFDATNATLEECGYETVTQEQINSWIGHGTRALLIKALAFIHNQSIEEIEAGPILAGALPVFDKHYQRCCGTTSYLYPHVIEVVKKLGAQGIKLAVVTNKESRYTDRVLAAHGLTELFDIVVSGDSFPVKKPDPTSILDCLEQWKVSADDALFVGDSSIDAATARNAGIDVWLLPYGYNMGEPIESANPDRVIQDFSELVA